MTPDKTIKRPYSVDPYNPEWVNKFEEIKSLLQIIFGSKALSIEHVGSTSVPGMRAKPLIDVLVTVKKMEDFALEKEKMLQKGYQWGEEYIEPNSLIFYKTNWKQKTENIHVCIKESPKAKQFIQMRNYLRAHPERAEEYSDLKENLKKQFPDDYPAYREGKDSYLKNLEKKATEWYREIPTLYIMCGQAFSGKSTLAKEIAKYTGAILVSQDSIWFVEEEKSKSLAQKPNYDSVLGISKKKIREALKQGRSAVFDNTNAGFNHREEFRQIANEFGAKTNVVYLNTSDEELKRRQEANRITKDRHDVNEEEIKKVRDRFEPPISNENVIEYLPTEIISDWLEREIKMTHDESKKQDFYQLLIDSKKEILNSAINIFMEISIECHTFGSTARGDSDALSDIDVWFTVKDENIKNILVNRNEYYSKMGEIIHICEPPQNSPINGVHSFLLFKKEDQLIPVDLYICPLSSSFKTKDAKHVFGDIQVPLGEITFNLQKVSVPESYRIDFLICFIFNGIKRIVRKKPDAFHGLLAQYDQLKDSYNIPVERLKSREPSFGCLEEIIENVKSFSNEKQKTVLGEISNFIDKIQKNRNPLVSVIIPTYNRKESVQRAINSVVEQGYKPLEIIVVDDGSTDGTYEYLSSLNLPIKLIHKNNGGVSSARNYGIKEAKGEYIAFLDSDDLWLPNKIALQVEYLQAHEDISIVYSDEYIEVDGKREETTRFQKNPPKAKMAYPGFVDLVPIHISSVLMKKDIFDEVGYFNEELQIHEDSDLWNRLSDKYEFGFISTPLAIYHWDTEEEHLMDHKDRAKFIQNSKRYLEIYQQEKKRELTPDEQEAVEESYKIIKKLESDTIL